MATDTIAPGARVRIRDAEWLVQRVDRTSSGDQVLDVVGLSELVKDKEARFLRELEEDAGDLELIDPAETELRLDTSPAFRTSRLYMESLLRKKAPTDDRLHVGHRAAMDPVEYQWEPALQALEQPRQRILIADGTGLGKTLEAGVLMSELIERGRGKRILVVALKSMMTQLQKEWWSRFTIPLTRLDSRGIQRIRERIPANHNPFYYYDKTIISIDTLKRGAEYRTYVEDADWDIVVVDEAQNAAKRGSSPSQRHRLVDLLSRRCDTMIMLSATPHDGSPESFASLMNMLDPTAIANPEDYTREDVDGLFIRRFKGDIKDQVDTAFLDRDVEVCQADASAQEEVVYDALADLEFEALDEEESGDVLFRTTLEKALFSSPAACLETVENRIERLEEDDDASVRRDVRRLHEFADTLRPIGADDFSKYQRLLSLLRGDDGGVAWDGSDPSDRLVIFSERLETLRFLEEHLSRDLDLDEEAIQTLHGGMSDVDQQAVVEDFGKDEADVRLLLASDIAAEGINLHYLCHRLVHFDIPWSLMIFQQRNGRIDRYGQDRCPQIRYMVTRTGNEDIHGDLRILEVLINKEQQAEENIDDPASLMGVYDVEKEQKKTADAMESGTSAEDFDEELQSGMDAMDLLLEPNDSEGVASIREQVAEPTSLFDGDFDYMRTVLAHLAQEKNRDLDFDATPDRSMIRLTADEEIEDRFRRLPDEIMPSDRVFYLSADPDEVQQAIRKSRQEEHAWPRTQYLWKLHPLLRWADDKVVAAFHRSEAPVLAVPTLEDGTSVVVCSGNIPNRKGQAVVNEWVGVRFRNGSDPEVLPFERVLDATGLGEERLPNRESDVDLDALRSLVPDAVDAAEAWMLERRKEKEAQLNEQLQEELDELETLKQRHERQLEMRFDTMDRPDAIVEGEKKKKQREIDRIFDDFYDWVENTMTTEEQAYIQVVAVLTGTRE
jgi:ERCC4-related helicase